MYKHTDVNGCRHATMNRCRRENREERGHPQPATEEQTQEPRRESTGSYRAIHQAQTGMKDKRMGESNYVSPHRQVVTAKSKHITDRRKWCRSEYMRE